MSLDWKSNSSQFNKILNTVFKFKTKGKLAGDKTDSGIIYGSDKDWRKKYFENLNQAKKLRTKVNLLRIFKLWMRYEKRNPEPIKNQSSRNWWNTKQSI